jgi:chromosome partitioning protein
MAKPIILTCANHKGGSGKTSLAGSLINALAEQGYRVLGIDGDMQRNLSTTYGLREFGKEKNLYRAIEDIDDRDDFNGANYIVKTEYDNIDFIVSHEDMALLETSLMMKMAEREKYVSKLVNSINEVESYDFIVFDTNPTLGVLNFNIFVASDHIIIPVECSAYGVDGLGAILKFYKNTRKVNRDLKIGGIVMQKVDIRKSIAKDAIEVVKDMFGEIIFKTMISIDTTVEKSQWDEIPLLYHSPDSRAANQYRDLVKEVLAVVGKHEVAKQK